MTKPSSVLLYQMNSPSPLEVYSPFLVTLSPRDGHSPRCRNCYLSAQFIQISDFHTGPISSAKDLLVLVIRSAEDKMEVVRE